MNYVNGQFVVLPQFTLSDHPRIKYTDTLTYIAVRSFSGYDECFPSYEAIAARAGCSRDFIIKSINRLKKAEWIEVQKGKWNKEKSQKHPNKYTFPTFYYMFEQIPFEIFDADLCLYDKAMLISLRQWFPYIYIWPFYKIIDLSRKLGLTYRVVHKRISSLINKGYIEVSKKRGNKYKFTGKLNWIWDYGNKNISTEKVRLRVG